MPLQKITSNDDNARRDGDATKLPQAIVRRPATSVLGPARSGGAAAAFDESPSATTGRLPSVLEARARTVAKRVASVDPPTRRRSSDKIPTKSVRLNDLLPAGTDTTIASSDASDAAFDAPRAQRPHRSEGSPIDAKEHAPAAAALVPHPPRSGSTSAGRLRPSAGQHLQLQREEQHRVVAQETPSTPELTDDDDDDEDGDEPVRVAVVDAPEAAVEVRRPNEPGCLVAFDSAMRRYGVNTAVPPTREAQHFLPHAQHPNISNDTPGSSSMQDAVGTAQLHRPTPLFCSPATPRDSKTARLFAGVVDRLLRRYPDFIITPLPPEAYHRYPVYRGGAFREPDVGGVACAIHAALRCSTSTSPMAAIFALVYMERLAHGAGTRAARLRAEATHGPGYAALSKENPNTFRGGAYEGAPPPKYVPGQTYAHHRLQGHRVTGLPTGALSFDQRFAVSYCLSLLSAAELINGDFTFTPSFYLRSPFFAQAKFVDPHAAAARGTTPLCARTMAERQWNFAAAFSYAMVVTADQLAQFVSRVLTDDEAAYVRLLAEEKDPAATASATSTTSKFPVR